MSEEEEERGGGGGGKKETPGTDCTRPAEQKSSRKPKCFSQRYLNVWSSLERRR